MPNSRPTTRRRFLRTVGGIGAIGVAGPVGSVAAQDGAIPMGSLLPITGELSDFGGGMQAAANLAVDHVNAAGGPLDRQISMTNRDSQTQPSAGLQKYTAMVNEQGIVGFVGAASSGVSTPIAQQVAQDRVMQVSNASTSPALAEIGYGPDGEPPKYFGRTAPNDGQQGIVMGRILGDDEFVGADSAAFLFVDNPYGAGLAEQAGESFEGEVVSRVPYAQQTADYTSTLNRLFQNDPDAIGFIGYPGNGRTIMQQWADGGYGGEWVLSEGLNSTSFLQELSDIVSGMYISSPNPEQTRGASTFEEAIGEQDTLFAPHAYDAVFLQALAIQRAGEASGTAIAENIRAVSRPPADAGADGETETPTEGTETPTEGTETPGAGTETPAEAAGNVVTVDEFERAKELLDAGEELNYQGASSPVDMNENLEPLNEFAILQVQDDGSTEILQTIPRSFFEGQL